MHVIESGDYKTISAIMWSAKRHLFTMVRHMNPVRIRNTSRCLFEMLTRRTTLRSHPFYLRIEVCPYCNLRCPGCLLGGLDISESSPDHRKHGLMSYEQFEAAIRDLAPYLIGVNLYDEGEPLLNADIYRMIGFLSAHNVGTCVSSNFSIHFTDETLGKMVDCGLEHLVVAVDGATQETYAQYRRGGELELVTSNIERLLAITAARNSPLQVEMQFIEFEDNAHERQQMIELAGRLGVWRLTIIQGSSRLGWKGIRFKGTPQERRKKGCFHLWIATTINSAGEMGTCDYGEDHGIPVIGQAKDYRSGRLRNHPRLVRLRESFRKNGPDLDPVCTHCSQYLH